MTVENSTLNRDSTFNRTVRLIESTEYLTLLIRNSRGRVEGALI